MEVMANNLVDFFRKFQVDTRQVNIRFRQYRTRFYGSSDLGEFGFSTAESWNHRTVVGDSNGFLYSRCISNCLWSGF